MMRKEKENAPAVSADASGTDCCKEGMRRLIVGDSFAPIFLLFLYLTFVISGATAVDAGT